MTAAVWPVSARPEPELGAAAHELWSVQGPPGEVRPRHWHPNSDVEALEKYSTHENDKCREFSNMLLNYRMHNKVLTTYIEKMIPWQDGNIHLVFAERYDHRLLVVGCLNFLNQPPSIRDMYIAGEGNTYVGADWNALELGALQLCRRS